MVTSNNESIKEIFAEIITEVDEDSLKSYVKFLNNYFANNYEDIKNIGFTFRKFTELKNFRKQQLVKIEKYLLEKVNQLNVIESKIKTAEKDYNALLEKIEKASNTLNNIIKEQNENLKELQTIEIRKKFFENNNLVYSNNTTANKYDECRKLLLELSFIKIPSIKSEIALNNINEKLFLLNNYYLNETKTFIERTPVRYISHLELLSSQNDSAILERIKELVSNFFVVVYKNNDQLLKNLGFK